MKKQETLKLYIVDEKYIEYLSKFDSHVSWNKKQKRLYIGIVLKVENYLYFAPLYSYKDNYNKYKENPSYIRIEDIYDKAKKIYRNVVNVKIPFFKEISCDFKLLEEKSRLYIN